MLGAIYGDKAGSIHEYGQIKTIKPVEVEQLIQENSFYKVLGEYFKKIEDAFYKQNNVIVKPFDTYFYNYKKQIISLLVM